MRRRIGLGRERLAPAKGKRNASPQPSVVFQTDAHIAYRSGQRGADAPLDPVRGAFQLQGRSETVPDLRLRGHVPQFIYPREGIRTTVNGSQWAVNVRSAT